MKRDKLIIILFSIVLGLIFIRSGSSMDFLNQHIVFPNYLREVFYSSGKIIPDFMIILSKQFLKPHMNRKYNN